MALQTQFALIHSEFNDFLFAPVGAEKNGVELTVLSALTRLGLDPWGEAARLAALPRDAAASALAAAFAALPEGDWTAGSVAVALVDRLPRHRAFVPGRPSQPQWPLPQWALGVWTVPRAARWLMWILAALVLGVLLLSHLPAMAAAAGG